MSQHRPKRRLVVDAAGAEGVKAAYVVPNCRLTMDESKAHWKWQGGLASLVDLLADHLIEGGPANNAVIKSGAASPGP